MRKKRYKNHLSRELLSPLIRGCPALHMGPHQQNLEAPRGEGHSQSLGGDTDPNPRPTRSLTHTPPSAVRTADPQKQGPIGASAEQERGMKLRALLAIKSQ